MTLLETKNLTRAFGGVVAVNNVDFQCEKGEVTGLIGPNGAGKTTFFNNITGLDKPTCGRVIFDGEDITGLPPYRIARKGIARTFQNIRLFKELTVIENVLIGLHFKLGGNPRFVAGMRSFLFMGKEREEMVERAYRALDFLGMSDKANELAKNLPYGHQRELEIARALASDPKLIFLDEPAAGMNPNETASLVGLIRRIKDKGISIVLIEHDMKLVMTICDSIVVLNYGNKIASGTPEQVRSNPLVIRAYLGGEGND